MSHYHIDIRVEADEVKVIKRDLKEFLAKAGTITVNVDETIEGYEELTKVVKNLMIKLLGGLVVGKFKFPN